MNDIHEYKCPACGGAVEFDSATQKMLCPFCGSSYEVSDFTTEAEEADKNGSENVNSQGFEMGGYGWQEGETEGMRVYSCNSCGGEIVGDANLGATKCPYCDNQIVMTGQFSGGLRPEYIIPFKLDKKAAKDKLKNHICTKKFVPKPFKDENHLDEIKGVYVPFWLFDADVDANISYNTTRVRHWTEGDYRCEETSYFRVERDGSIAFERIPADGSSKMDDTLMESIEPFDFSGAVPFQMAYMAGYVADKYDVEAESCLERINSRIKNSTVECFRDTVKGYNSVITNSTNLNIKNGKTHYVLYPVWLLNTSWNGNRYVFAMNGQTGKFVGNSPLDKKAWWKAFGIMTTVTSALVFGIKCLTFFL